MAYTLLHRDAEAVAEYRKTLELKPGLYEAELNGGIVLLRQKNPAEALPLFEDAARAEAAGVPSALLSGRIAAPDRRLRQGGRELQAGHRAGREIRRRATRHGAGAGAAGTGSPTPTPISGRRRNWTRSIATTCWNSPASMRRPRRTAKPSRSTGSFRTTPAAQARLGELLLESKQFEDAVPAPGRGLWQGSQPGQPERSGGRLRLHPEAG